jgi:hypothetical protein
MLEVRRPVLLQKLLVVLVDWFLLCDRTIVNIQVRLLIRLKLRQVDRAVSLRSRLGNMPACLLTDRALLHHNRIQNGPLGDRCGYFRRLNLFIYVLTWRIFAIRALFLWRGIPSIDGIWLLKVIYFFHWEFVRVCVHVGIYGISFSLQIRQLRLLTKSHQVDFVLLFSFELCSCLIHRLGVWDGPTQIHGHLFSGRGRILPNVDRCSVFDHIAHWRGAALVCVGLSFNFE